MKKSLKVISPLLGLFCLFNCSECNNFATKDCFGGNGDVDYPTYIRDFSRSSKDFEDLIKNYNTLCYCKQVYPNLSDKFISSFALALQCKDEYRARLLLADKSKLSKEGKAVVDQLNEEDKNRKKVDELKKMISVLKTDAAKEIYQNELKALLEKNSNLLKDENPIYVFQDKIEKPTKLNGDVKILKVIISVIGNVTGSDLIFDVVWNIEGSGGSIDILKYYFGESSSDYLNLDFSSGRTTQTYNYSRRLSFSSDDIFKTLNFAIIPKCFVECENFKIVVDLTKTPGFHMTSRFPYFELQRKNFYVYKRNEKNSYDCDLSCCFGLAKNECLKSKIIINYSSRGVIDHLEGAMPIFNGPYVLKSPCIIKESYDTTNLPDRSFAVKYDTFDHEFFIKGIKDNKLTLSFENLKMIKDIKNRFYSGLNGEGFINFGETSNRILRIYAQRILSECFGVGEHACPCTKLAALNQFVHYWINYGDHERTHAMTPVEIFTYRKGICVDYTHLFIGFCSSIGIYNVAKVSGVGFNSLKHCEKHSWVICYCPGCKQYYEFDPTWGQCYQVGPEHLFISKTQRINDSIDKSSNGEVNRYLEVYINGIKIPIIE